MKAVPRSPVRPSNNGKPQRSRAAAFALAVCVAYPPLYPLLFQLIDEGAGTFASLPTLTVAWVFGPRAGIAAALLVIPLNTLLFNLMLDSPEWVLHTHDLPGMLLLVPVAYVTGRLRQSTDAAAQAQQARQQQELVTARVRATVDHALDGLLVVDLNSYRIVEANQAAAQLLDVPLEKLRGSAVEEKVAILDRADTWQEVTRRARLSGNTLVFEGSQPPGIGSAKPLEASCGIRNFLGQEQLVIAMRDISDRMQADRLRRLYVGHVLASQEKESRRVARELHDEAGQWLTSLIAKTGSLESTHEDPEVQKQFRDLRHLAELTHEEIGRIARRLHPSVLDRLGLCTALRKLAREASESHGLKVDVAVDGISDTHRLPQPVELAVYRIVQEALTNIARHAEASSVSILVNRRSGLVRVVVEDDGIGFDEHPRASEVTDGFGVGLVGIRERATLLGGSARIESTVGEGTTVMVEIPVGREAQ